MRVNIGPYEDRTNEVGERLDRRINIHIDNYDTWNMDHTLAMIIVPLLKQLKETGHGAPGDMVEFQQTSNQAQDSFPFYAEGDDAAWDAGHARWHSILDEMIWAFEQVIDPKEDQFWIEKPMLDWEADDIPLAKHGVFDRKGFEEYSNRIDRGLQYFGQYYRGLWD